MQKDTTGLTLDSVEGEDPLQAVIRKSLATPGGSATAPGLDAGMDGAPGAGAEVGFTGAPDPGVEGTLPPGGLTPDLPGAGPTTPKFSTRLLEGAPEKLGNAQHMAESPKYDFLTLANSGKYNYDQMPDMLKDLQSGPNAKQWQGWTADGKGNLVFAGDPNQLDPSWKGVKRVDAVGAFGDFKDGKGGNATGWRWGVDDPNAAPGGGGVGAGAGTAMSQGGSDPVGLTSSDFFQQLLARARDAAGPGSVDQKALLSQMG